MNNLEKYIRLLDEYEERFNQKYAVLIGTDGYTLEQHIERLERALEEGEPATLDYAYEDIEKRNY